MAYLITGGTGLIGSRIVRDLVKEGEQAVVYDLFVQEDTLMQLLSQEERSRVKIVQGDVTDLPNLLHVIKDNNVERVIHLAALLALPSALNPPLAIKVNCEGTANVFESARLMGLKKVVWASTIAVFGPPEKYPQEYIPNDAPHFPEGATAIYGGCKSFCEVVMNHYVKTYGLDISAIRYSVVYGTGQGSAAGVNARILKELIENPVAGKPGRVPFGDDVISWLYVSDAAGATVALSKVVKPKTKAFTIAGDLRPVKEAVEYVKSLMPGADIAAQAGTLGVSFKYDTTPIEREIGYRLKWSMEEGLRESVNMMRQRYGLPAL